MTASTSRAPLTTADYPLSVNRPDLLRTPTGKALSELTMDAVVSGALTAADVRIAPETLLLQAEIADAARRPQLAANFRRAAEMTAIPDAEVPASPVSGTRCAPSCSRSARSTSTASSRSGPRRASSRWRARSTRSRACVSRTA
jgi:hypothetical protein